MVSFAKYEIQKKLNFAYKNMWNGFESILFLCNFNFNFRVTFQMK
jgi:hypothetical protein